MVHIDMTACQYNVNLLFQHIPKELFLAIQIQGIAWLKTCRAQETSLRSFEVCDMAQYPPGSSHQEMGTQWS